LLIAPVNNDPRLLIRFHSLSQIRSTVTIIVCIFIAWGTAYDSLLKRRHREKTQVKSYVKELHSESSGLNCTTYDLTRAIGDKKSTCVGIGIPSNLNNNNSDENLAADSTTPDDNKNLSENNI
jgi:hypothetical protein